MLKKALAPLTNETKNSPHQPTLDIFTQIADPQIKDDPWHNQPDLIRRFLEQRPAYEQLCSEVGYIIKKSIEKAEIRLASISFRAKELNSFLEKAIRKDYPDPFDRIPDFAGVRVVCYYSDETNRIVDLIREEFSVLDVEDKSLSAGVDRFGYGGVHLVVKLGEASSGARYDDLKDLKCEIQVRTVMQDAWSLLSHHLIYKREDETPPALRRRINALAGALDSADVAFQAIREKRDEYIASIAASTAKSSLARITINLDSLTEYLKSKFPELPVTHKIVDVSDIVKRLHDADIEHLDSVDLMLNQSAKAREFVIQSHPRKSDLGFASCGAIQVHMAAVLCNHKYADQWRKIHDRAPEILDLYNRGRELIRTT